MEISTLVTIIIIAKFLGSRFQIPEICWSLCMDHGPSDVNLGFECGIFCMDDGPSDVNLGFECGIFCMDHGPSDVNLGFECGIFLHG